MFRSLHPVNLFRAATLFLFIATVAIAWQAKALAQEWPSKPVKVVMPYPAGGTSDVLVRAIGERLREKWKQPLIVDNKPGGSFIIATEAMTKSPADGYTFLWTTNAITAINPIVHKNLPYNATKDLAAVTEVMRADEFLIVNAALPVKNLREFIAYAKEHPGKVNFGSFGQTSATYLIMAMLENIAGIKLAHVPYKGVGQIVPDLIENRVQAVFTSVLAMQDHIKDGKLRVLAIGSAERSQWLPDIPTFQEQGVKLEASTWFGLTAPAGTPKEIIETVARDFRAVIRDPEFQKKYMVHYRIVGSLPDEFAQLIRQDQVLWAERVKQIGVKFE